jgi:hypothetical protein
MNREFQVLIVTNASLGYKFETLSLLPEPWDSTSRQFIESRETHIVNNKAQYCSVVRTGIGEAKLVIGGEVDAGMISPFRFHNLLLYLCVLPEPFPKLAGDVNEF